MEVDHTDLFQVGIQELPTKCLMLRMRQILIAAILIHKGDDETMGESVVQILRAGIPAPFEILDEWQPRAQIAERPLDTLHRGRWDGIVELEQHDVPIDTVSLCHKSLLIFCLVYAHILITFLENG
jgi:hypothetical protein